MPKRFDIEKFNKILEEHKQKLRAETITGTEIVLSNGLVLTDKSDIRVCKKRVMFGDKVWKANFDRIYGVDKNQRDIAEKQCRSSTSRKGGIKCQKTHSNKIKNNLNTGKPWNKGLKGKYPYSHPCSAETKKKISVANSGSKNGMFGRKHTNEEKQYRSKLMKEKILSGEFTPNSNNRNTHWDSFYKNKKYRSSWEALYQYFDQEAEYETLRITYVFNDKEYVYIIDFVNHKNKTVIEVKPTELTEDSKTQAKISAAKNWCDKNGYTFILADQDYFISKSKTIELDDFDVKTQNKIRKLYETG